MSKRVPALDALRGLLALVVVSVHIGLAFGSRIMILPGFVAVLGFFTLSGFVLARTYATTAPVFVIKRLIRLWPLYAVCIVAGYALIGRLPPIGELAWLTFPAWGSAPAVDAPAWSLYYEAWGTLAFPATILLARKSFVACVALTLAVALLGLWDFRFFLGAFFAAGIAASQLDIRFPARVHPWLVWLGRISFSLYITHQIVLTAAARLAGPWGAVAALPVVVAVAYAAWWAIERPSVALSRIFGRRFGAVGDTHIFAMSLVHKLTLFQR